MKVLFNLAHQPLLQFLLLGGLIFAVDKAVVGNDQDPRRIIIDDAKYAEIAGIFQDNQGRLPSSQEMAALTIQWAQNEVLYREARLMKLDDGDEMIRQRLILKLRNVLFNKVVTETPEESVLLDWFEAHRAKYDKPESYDVEQFQVAELGNDGRQQAAELADRLGSAEPDEVWRDKVRRYRKRSEKNLQSLFEVEDVPLLTKATTEHWVPVRSVNAWHLARITTRHAERLADFGQIRKRVLEDWKADAIQDELVSTLGNIASNYDIRMRLSENGLDIQPQAIEKTLAAGVLP